MSTYRTPIGTLRTETDVCDDDSFKVRRFFIDGEEATPEEVQEFWNRVRGHYAMTHDCPPLWNINYT